jgi:hypothetical protein
MHTTTSNTKTNSPKTLASPAPSHRVNLVNPVHPSSSSASFPFPPFFPVQPSSTSRRDPAPKPNRSGAPLQTNALDRTKSESTPDQKRTEPGSKVEKSSQPIANQLTQNPENKNQGEPTEPIVPTAHNREDRAAFRRWKNMHANTPSSDGTTELVNKTRSARNEAKRKIGFQGNPR